MAFSATDNHIDIAEFTKKNLGPIYHAWMPSLGIL